MLEKILITTRDGKLVQSGEFIKSELFQPLQKFEGGNLSIEATTKNIHAVCESLLALFMRPKGMGLKKHPDWEWKYRQLDVVRKYTNGTYPPERSDENLTRGWCYLLSGAFHRFFFHHFDLYRVPCPLTPTGIDPKTNEPYKQDYHWWLESKCRKYVIDLTEEQYLNVGIKNVRLNGKQMSPMGRTSYGLKARNIAYIVATHRYPDAIDFRKIPETGYVKKYPEFLNKLKSSDLLNGFDEKKHAHIHLIQFHKGHHKKVHDVHLENEITEYWKRRHVEFDPNESLDKPIRLIEKASDKLYKKSDYFLIKKLVLVSNQTKKLIVEETFTKTLAPVDDNDFTEIEKFDQKIRIRNSECSIGSSYHKEIGSLLMEMDEYRLEMESIQEKYLKAREQFYKKQEEIITRSQLAGSTVRRFKDSFPKDHEGKSTFEGWKFD